MAKWPTQIAVEKMSDKELIDILNHCGSMESCCCGTCVLKDMPTSLNESENCHSAIMLEVAKRYERATELLFNCLNCLVNNAYEMETALTDARAIGFTDEEIENFGFGCMLDIEE